VWLLNHRYKVCQAHGIDPDEGNLGMLINEVLTRIREDIADTLRWEHVPDENDEDSYTAKWVQQCKPWEPQRERNYQHSWYPSRDVLDGMTKSTLGQVFGHYSFAQCLLALGPRKDLKHQFELEVQRQHVSQAMLKKGPQTQILRVMTDFLGKKVELLEQQLRYAPAWDTQRVIDELDKTKEQSSRAQHVSRSGRDTAPRGIVARVSYNMLGGLRICEKCTAPGCDSHEDLAICCLCSHMVCIRHLPTFKQTAGNNSSLVECIGLWGPGMCNQVLRQGFHVCVFTHSWCVCTRCPSDTPCCIDMCTNTRQVRATMSYSHMCVHTYRYICAYVHIYIYIYIKMYAYFHIVVCIGIAPPMCLSTLAWCFIGQCRNTKHVPT
jgi:hypothetical protein